MNLNDIHSLVAQGETESLEFKKSTAKLNSAARTLCGFLNGIGGIVLIGVTDNKSIVLIEPVPFQPQFQKENALAILSTIRVAINIPVKNVNLPNPAVSPPRLTPPAL